MVYPHVCGGTGRSLASSGRGYGLSPRMRGNLLCGGQLANPRGSIPAYAGEPWRGNPRRDTARVYPRGCGGTRIRHRHCRHTYGLSPRMRGNLSPSAPTSPPAGSIPAYAGEPADGAGAAVPGWVYPRVCGGTDSRPVAAARTGGLSPRMRGNPPPSKPGAVRRRSIPAYAGEPVPDDADVRVLEVYPRVCGGTHRPGRVRG